MLAPFIAIASRLLVVGVCREWPLTRAFFAVSSAITVARMVLAPMRSAPWVLLLDGLLFLLHSVVLVKLCGGSALAALTLLHVPSMVAMDPETRRLTLTLYSVALQAYAVAAGISRETMKFKGTADQRALVAASSSGLVAGLFMSDWVSVNAVTIATSAATCAVYVVRNALNSRHD